MRVGSSSWKIIRPAAGTTLQNWTECWPSVSGSSSPRGDVDRERSRCGRPCSTTAAMRRRRTSTTRARSRRGNRRSRSCGVPPAAGTRNSARAVIRLQSPDSPRRRRARASCRARARRRSPRSPLSVTRAALPPSASITQTSPRSLSPTSGVGARWSVMRRAITRQPIREHREIAVGQLPRRRERASSNRHFPEMALLERSRRTRTRRLAGDRARVLRPCARRRRGNRPPSHRATRRPARRRSRGASAAAPRRRRSGRTIDLRVGVGRSG